MEDIKIIKDIFELKNKKNAVILAHNYQLPEIQDIADFIGDSLELSRQAASTDASIIVFCGVHFMAETAKMLSPDKTVLLPDTRSGCPMADMVTVEDVKKLRLENPGAAIVCYINTSAAVKAECDICCTSGNAVEVVNSVAEDTIVFLPDRNLGNYVSKHTKKKMIIWNGYCPTHENLRAKDAMEVKKQHPEAEFLAHPECMQEVLEIADKIASTSGILKYAKNGKNRKFIIGTEIGILYRLKKENHGKEFIPASRSMFCQNMKYNSLESVYRALVNEEPEIEVPEHIRKKAFLTIQRMLDIKK